MTPSNSQNETKKALFWFRRDLRLYDNIGLSYALAQYDQVFCVFVFDRHILDQIENKFDRRVEFIWHSIYELKKSILGYGGDLIVLDGKPEILIPNLAHNLNIQTVITNHDYEPYSIQRDQSVKEQLSLNGIYFSTFKDQVIFEKDEVLTGQRRPYTVFTPYRNNWIKKLTPDDYQDHPNNFRSLYKHPDQSYSLPSLEEIGFKKTNLLDLKIVPGELGAQALLNEFLPRMPYYHQKRDYPGIRGVSYLSIHLRFGTVSIRQLVRAALQSSTEGGQTWLNELVWRDFYFAILWHFPHVVTQAFKKEWNQLVFENDRKLFDAWCKGQTGYPIVDAAMRQLLQTGFMHNRLRMVSASFLVKDLQIDWRWGEAFFASHLNDFDLSANNGGWQWSASTGCDAQPWFRIFNPVTQSERFDEQGHFIRRYCPELNMIPDKKIHAPWLLSPMEQEKYHCRLGVDYPNPVIDHAKAREQTLKRYQLVTG